MNKLKKIAKALKVALLSLFYMDLQIDVEKEEEEKKKLKVFRLASILLTITTILWLIFFYPFPAYFLIIGLALFTGWLGFIVVAIGKFLERKR